MHGFYGVGYLPTSHIEEYLINEKRAAREHHPSVRSTELHLTAEPSFLHPISLREEQSFWVRKWMILVVACLLRNGAWVLWCLDSYRHVSPCSTSARVPRPLAGASEWSLNERRAETCRVQTPCSQRGGHRFSTVYPTSDAQQIPLPLLLTRSSDHHSPRSMDST
jgi:hypothetical protein